MVIAAEGTPIQAVLLGLLWVVWFGVMAIWPRQSLMLFQRHRRWQRGGSTDWPVPQVREEPKAPTDRAVTFQRIGAVVFIVFGLFLTAQGITRL